MSSNFLLRYVSTSPDFFRLTFPFLCLVSRTYIYIHAQRDRYLCNSHFIVLYVVEWVSHSISNSSYINDKRSRLLGLSCPLQLASFFLAYPLHFIPFHRSYFFYYFLSYVFLCLSFDIKKKKYPFLYPLWSFLFFKIQKYILCVSRRLYQREWSL